MDDLRNPELEAAIAYDPYDRDAYLVYADWLEGHGHPRAELIALQCGARPKVARPAKAIRRILNEHANQLLGPLAPYAQRKGVTFRWEYGFIHAVSVEDSEVSVEQTLAALAAHSSGCLVAELSLSTTDLALPAVLAVLAAHPFALRELRMHVRSTANLEADLAAIWQFAPSLRTFSATGRLRLAEIAAPAIREVQLSTTQLTSASARALGEASWPGLEQLAVSLEQCAAGPADLAPLLARTDLAALRRLALTQAPFPLALCRAVIASPLVARLRQLVLRGSVDEASALELVAGAAALSHLELLDVREAALSDETLEALEQMCPGRVEYDRYDDAGE